MENHRSKILVADDEAALRQILNTRLSLSGYDVVTAADGKQALDVFFQEKPDLIVLDVMMPKFDGYQVCQELRKASDVPIVMLTALGDVADRITGLQLGADDYLVKPFSPKELEARIRSILRRVQQRHTPSLGSSGVIQAGALNLDTNKRRVYLKEQLIRLTGIEFDLLEFLIKRSGAAVSRPEILQTIWGYSSTCYNDLRIVDVHISRLRAKLQEDPKQPEFITTVRGTGYLFHRGGELPEAAGVELSRSTAACRFLY